MKTFGLALTAAAVALTLLTPLAARAQTAASEWMQGNSSRIRLIAGKIEPAGPIVAGVQIELDDGWKTYWRNPGDAGGVPPELDWSASANLVKSELTFPAPTRLRDVTGENIGYKHGVMLPVVLQPADPAQPIRLDLKIMFGVCQKICIPEERHLTLTLDPKAGADQDIAALLAQAVATVPVDPAKTAKAPQIQAIKLDTAAGKPSILIATTFPAGSDGADLFVESSEGSYLPMTEKLADSGDGSVKFRIDLSKTDDFKSPSGKSLKFTLVSKAGASESIRVLP